jgi:hypothetical protein
MAELHVIQKHRAGQSQRVRDVAAGHKKTELVVESIKRRFDLISRCQEYNSHGQPVSFFCTAVNVDSQRPASVRSLHRDRDDRVEVLDDVSCCLRRRADHVNDVQIVNGRRHSSRRRLPNCCGDRRTQEGGIQSTDALTRERSKTERLSGKRRTGHTSDGPCR